MVTKYQFAKYQSTVRGPLHSNLTDKNSVRCPNDFKQKLKKRIWKNSRQYIHRITYPQQPDKDKKSLEILIKVAFFQKVWFGFQISKSPKKYIPNYYPELEIWICCLLLLAGNLNFMFRIVIWNIFFGDLKNTSHFLKKNTFKIWRNLQILFENP